jgi:outer membrane protein OmpA-like peptidoglycan-associated protein
VAEAAAEPETEVAIEAGAETAAETEVVPEEAMEPAEVAATPVEPEAAAEATEPATAEATVPATAEPTEPATVAETPMETTAATTEVAEPAVAIVAEETAPGAETSAEEPEVPAETQVAAVAPEAVETPKIAAPPPAVVSIPSRVVFDATRTEGSPIVLAGEVSTEPARAYFGVIAGKVPTDGMTVSDGLPEDFIPNADAGLRILANLYDGRLAFDGTHWYLTGTANTEAERAALAEQALITLPPSGRWVTGIAVTPPIKLCRLTVANFATNNPILFQSGSARMTDESMASLGELATDLQFCPDTAVYVEGHTDADGPDDLNLALSVARAEAVVDALVGLGVGYQRLYAVGYGESLPIADNETAAGKRANRRIVFTIEDKEQ